MNDSLNKKRSVINKYTDVPSNITDNVCTMGEIVISTQKGSEGIYIKNNASEIIKISGNINQFISKSQYEKLIEEGEIYIMNEIGEPIIVKYDENVYYMVYEDDENNSVDFSNDEITLESNYFPFETTIIEGGLKTLNLNGYTMKSAPAFIDESDGSTNSYGLWVKGGKIEIDGEGIIEARDAQYSMAIWANGGEVVIKNGTFINHGDGCDLIYASNGGKVYIYGGEFIATEFKGTEPGTGNKHSALNIKNSDRMISDILVYGGRFYGFDPANNLSEPNPSEEWLKTHPNGFVAEGYKSIQDGDYWVVVKDEE